MMSSDDLHQVIKEILQRHVGINDQISAGEIGPALGVFEDATDVQARNLILEVIEKVRLPIGAGQKVYYLIKDKYELTQYINSLYNRIDGIQKRKDLIEEAFIDYYR